MPSGFVTHEPPPYLEYEAQNVAKVVGTNIDGKPIYEKTLVVTLSSTNQQIISVAGQNVIDIKFVSGYAGGSAIRQVIGPYAIDSNNQVILFVLNDYLQVRIGGSYLDNKQAVITYRYTLV